MRALAEAARRIPQDVAIIGFDDRLDAVAQSPPLTSIHFPAFESGYRALALLLKLIDGQAAADAVINIPTRLVIRASCGCEPGGGALPSPTAVRSNEWSEDEGAGRPTPGKEPEPPDPRKTTSNPSESEASLLGAQIVQAMSEAVRAESTLAEGQRLSVEEVQALCERLWQTLLAALAESNLARFQSVLIEILGRAAAVGDD